MEYSWYPIHHLILNSFKPQQLLMGNSRTNAVLWLQAEEAMEKMPGNLIERVCNVTSKKEKRELIHACQAGGIFLANQVHNYATTVAALSSKEPVKQQTLLGYQKLKTKILEVLDLLRNYFPKNNNPSQPLPDCLFEEQQLLLQQQIDKTTGIWENRIDGALLELALQPARDFINTRTGPKPSYRQWEYLLKLFEKIDRLSHICPPDAGTAFLHILINCNFNQGAFIDYAVAVFQQKTAGEDMLEKIVQYQKLTLYLPRFHSQPGMALHPGRADCQQTLSTIFQQELNLLEKQLDQMKALPAGATENLPFGMFEVKTCLSGAQLALCMRVFNDNKMLECTPETRFFKFVAENVLPPRGKPYTAGTLKTKYYEPDPAAISIMKDRFIKIINYLNSL